MTKLRPLARRQKTLDEALFVQVNLTNSAFVVAREHHPVPGACLARFGYCQLMSPLQLLSEASSKLMITSLVISMRLASAPPALGAQSRCPASRRPPAALKPSQARQLALEFRFSARWRTFFGHFLALFVRCHEVLMLDIFKRMTRSIIHHAAHSFRQGLAACTARAATNAFCVAAEALHGILKHRWWEPHPRNHLQQAFVRRAEPSHAVEVEMISIVLQKGA